MLKITKNDVIYIAGPMRGYHFYNYPRFWQMEAILKDVFGSKTLNPARNQHGLTFEQYMEIDLASVRRSTGIFLLNGWIHSIGANREYREARIYNKKIFYEKEVFEWLITR